MTRDGYRDQDEIGSSSGINAPSASASSSTKSNELRGFDAFWAEFPLRKAKIAARTAYDKARKVASHEQIMAGVRRYKPKQGFCKHPATWLNQGCWDDDEQIGAKVVPLNAARVFKCPDCLQVTIGTACGYCRRQTA